MNRYPAALRLAGALLLLGAAGCGDETTNNYYTAPEPPPPPPLDCSKQVYTAQPTIAAHTSVTGKAVLTVGGLQFKDLNGNGTLQPYEDWRLLEVCRAQDLVSRMTVPEKVGLMSEGMGFGNGTPDGSIPASVSSFVVDSHGRQGLIRLGTLSAQQLAVYLNNLQELCEAQPLGIPCVITTDPSHGFGSSTNPTTGAMTLSAPTVVSPWPYPMGLGAINDEVVTRQYGDAVRHEFMAMGFRWQLGPMADLATEPRWARVQNVFGENALHAAKHVQACVEGFQGEGDGGLKNGIAATMKHFPGAGANEDGMDSHSYPGRFNVYPGDNFAYHQIPFQAAIDVGVAAVMPCYSIFKDQWDVDPLQVGAAYSKPLITDSLKTTLGFTGMVTADWGVLGFLAPWGVQPLTQAERAAMFVKAGSHQLGLDSASNIQDAYDQGLLAEEEIGGAATKILEMSFKLGIFENPYVDPAAAATTVRSQQNLQDGFDAQKKAIVLLKNLEHTVVPCAGFFCPPPSPLEYLPIDGARMSGTTYLCDTNADSTVSVYYDGVDDALTGTDIYSPFLGDYDYSVPTPATGALPVAQAASPATADIAVLRITARKGAYFGLDAGVPLSFDGPFPGTQAQADTSLPASIKDRNKVIDLLRIRDGYTQSDGTVVPAANPTLKIVLVMHMDRPGIVKPFLNGFGTLDERPGEPGSYPGVSDPDNIRADGLGGVDAFLVDFGAFDRAVLDFLFNQNAPAGFTYGSARLPVEIPSSDEEVQAQFEDLPNDTLNPTYTLGAGSGF